MYRTTNCTLGLYKAFYFFEFRLVSLAAALLARLMVLLNDCIPGMLLTDDSASLVVGLAAPIEVLEVGRAFIRLAAKSSDATSDSGGSKPLRLGLSDGVLWTVEAPVGEAGDKWRS